MKNVLEKLLVTLLMATLFVGFGARGYNHDFSRDEYDLIRILMELSDRYDAGEADEDTSFEEFVLQNLDVD